MGASPLLVAPHRGGFGGWRCCCELSVCLGQQLPEPEQAPGVCFLLVDSFFPPEFQPSRASGLFADLLVGAVSPSLLHAARGLLVLLGSSFTPLCLPQQPCPSPSLCSLLPVGVLCFPSHFSTSGLPRVAQQGREIAFQLRAAGGTGQTLPELSPAAPHSTHSLTMGKDFKP